MIMCACVHAYRCTRLDMSLVGPGNSLGVSVAFPSFTFPLRFRHVSVTFPSVSVSVSVTFPPRFRHVSIAFPLRFHSRFCCASVGDLAQHGGADERGQPSRSEARTFLAQWLRPRLVTCGLGFDPGGSTFPDVSSDMLPIAASLGDRCDVGQRVALTRMCVSVFAAASENPRVAKRAQ